LDEFLGTVVSKFSEFLVIICSSVDFSLVFFTKDWDDGVWQELENYIPWKSKDTNEKADTPLGVGKSSNMHLQGGTTTLDDQELSNYNNNPNTNKHGICKESFKDVNLIINLSRSKHVENLEAHEQIEDDSHVS
jgi:hypothetical protein